MAAKTPRKKSALGSKVAGVKETCVHGLMSNNSSIEREKVFPKKKRKETIPAKAS